MHRKGEAAMMSPDNAVLHVPDELHLERHANHYPVSDEPVGVFTEDHRCLAVIEVGPESIPPVS
jgi:hypothetical protein